MRISKLITLSIMLGFLFALSCSGNPKPFNIEQFEKRPTTVIKKFIGSERVENITTPAFQKVAVIEFNVEFLIDIPEPESIRLTDKMYKIFTESMESNVGWEIISKDLIAKNPVYKLLRKKQLNRRSVSPKYGNEQNEVISTIYPTSKLSILQQTKKRVGSSHTNRAANELIEAAILEDIGASAVLKVHTVVDYFYERGEGKIIITPVDDQAGSKLEILIDYSKILSPGMGYKARDQKDYIYAYKNQCSFILKEPLVAYENISAKKSTFPIEEFAYQLEEIFTIYAEMLAMAIAEDL